MRPIHSVTAHGRTYRVYTDQFEPSKTYLRIDNTPTTQSVGGHGLTGLYFDELADAVPRSAKSILMLGLGCGTVARLLRERGDRSRILGVEPDGVVLDLARRYFGLDGLNVTVVKQTAEEFLNSGCPVMFDAVIVDAYADVYEQVVVGPLLEKARSLIVAGGVLVVNDYTPDAGNVVIVERV